MKKLLKSIEDLKDSKVKNLVDTRLKEFKKLQGASNDEIFQEICFCILTANCNAEKCVEIQKKIGRDFSTLSESQLAEKLQQLGYRFPKTRARYIVDGRKYKNSLEHLIQKPNDAKELREWLVNNVKGIGYKEASHFLRNMGYTNLAIIDFHILDVLTKHGLIEKPKALTRKNYMRIEDLLRKIAENSKLTLAELDLYLWYMETGQILK